MVQKHLFNLYLARTAGMLSGARRVAMMLVTFLLTMTAQTAWAEVTYQWDKDTKTLTFSGSGELIYDEVSDSGHRDDVKTAVIGSGVTSIIGAFYDCSNLTTVTFEPGSQLTSIGDNAFANCSNLTSIAIPNSVTTIGFGAFTECYGLKSFIIPASVTSIENCAFFRCNLEIVVVQRYTSGESPITSLVDDPFNGCDALKMICVPNDEACIAAYKSASNWDKYEEKIQAINNYCGDPEVNDGKNVYYAYYLQPGTSSDATLAIAGSGAMNNNSAQPWLGFDVKTVNIGYGVTSISKYAFYNRNSLTSVPIPSSVTSIGNNAFEGCTGLTSITIPASVESIGELAFDKCTGLTSVSIPNSVTSIYGNTFNGCEKLESINVDVNNQNYASEDGVLFNKDKTILIKYPIGKSGTSYDIPASVTSIGENAFNGCNTLTSITIPASVTTIGGDAFIDCINMADVYCYADPTKLTWGDTGDNFGTQKPKCHVADADAWSGFSSVNVTFVGDLADVSVPYIDADGNTAYCTDFTVIDGTETRLDAGWYICNTAATENGGKGLSYTSTLQLYGDVHLILADNCKMTVETTSDMAISSISNIAIYGQSTGDNAGSLIANANNYGINASGNITISGGQVIATGTNHSGICSGAGKISITDCNVTATGGSYGIYASGIITISGEKVEAIATGTNGNGINTGASKITITDGEVIATGGSNGIKGGAEIIINKGKVTANGTSGSGIESGSAYNISITDCEVNAEGGNNGIKSGSYGVTINGGKVTATGTNGSGIESVGPSNISITNCEVNAEGGSNGIIGSNGVTISGGQVVANYTGSSGYGIYSGINGITLGWTNATDYICAKSYATNYNGPVKIAEGNSLLVAATGTTEAPTDALVTGSAGGTSLTSTQVAAIAGKTLRAYNPSTAQTSMPFIDEKGKTMYCYSYTELSGETDEPATIGTAGETTWYVVTNSNAQGVDAAFIYDDMIALGFRGDVHLILADGAEMQVSSYENSDRCGMQGDDGANLTIYVQSAGTGKLSLLGSSDLSTRSIADGEGGNLTICGGTVSVAQSIGAVRTEGCTGGGNLTICGGTVSSGFCIITQKGGNLTISGGTVTARDFISAGGGNLTISGGQVTANDYIYAYDNSGINHSPLSVKIALSSATDYVYAGDYGFTDAGDVVCPVIITGELFSINGDGSYYGRVSGSTVDGYIDAFRGRTLRAAKYLSETSCGWYLRDQANTTATIMNVPTAADDVPALSAEAAEVLGATGVKAILVDEATTEQVVRSAEGWTHAVKAKIFADRLTLFAEGATNTWATFCAAAHYVIPEGCTAYAVTSVSDGTVTIEEVPIVGFDPYYQEQVVPAFAPVLIKRTSDVDVPTGGFEATFAGVEDFGNPDGWENIDNGKKCIDPDNNIYRFNKAYGYDNTIGYCWSEAEDNDMLLGNMGTANDGDIPCTFINPEGYTSYMLYNGEFVCIDTNNGLAAHRCVLNVANSTTNGARVLTIGTGDATGITAQPMFNGQSSMFNEDSWYSIDGRKLDGMPTKKGLYINNGRKVVIK